MMEPQDVDRFTRQAQAFGEKINDAEALDQAAGILEAFGDAYYSAMDRLLDEGMSYGELARALRRSRQAVQQQHARWHARAARRHDTP